MEELMQFKEYFKFNTENDKTICQIEGCGKIYSGYRTTNLWRHLESAHREIYEHVLPERKVRKKARCENFILDMRQAIVELCTVNGRPFSIVEDSGFVKMVNIACETAGENSPDYLKIHIPAEFNVETLKTDINAAYLYIKMQISLEVKNTLVALMVDIRSKRGKAILGIQIQYIVDDKIKVRTIGMIRMLRPHTGAYIAELIESKLKEYNISLDQIYSLTTDNGANMLKAVSLVGHSARDLVSLEEECEEIDDELLIDPTELESLICELWDINDNTNLDGAESVLTEAAAIIRGGDNSSIEYALGLSCGAHTLQLEIFGSIKQWDNETGLVGKCRTIMARLKNQNFIDILVNRNCNLPINDSNPRWWTIYMMVNNIYTYIEFSYWLNN